MAKLRIGEGELLMAFESGDGTVQWFLDRQTGAVIPLGDDYLSYDDDEDEVDEDEEPQDPEEEARRIRRAINADEDDARYLEIPSLGSHEGFRIMERFAGAQEDGRVREALFDALDRRRPFRSFKDALSSFPEVRERWYAYHEQQLREHALDWLRAEEIDAELTRPTPPSE